MATKKNPQNSCKAYCNPPRKKNQPTKMIRTHKPLRTPTASPNLTSLAIKKDFCGDWGIQSVLHCIYQIDANLERLVVEREGENISHPIAGKETENHQLKSASADWVEIPVIRNPGGYND